MTSDNSNNVSFVEAKKVEDGGLDSILEYLERENRAAEESEIRKNMDQ